MKKMIAWFALLVMTATTHAAIFIEDQAALPTDPSTTLVAQPGKPVNIFLKSIPTTGYRWYIQPYDENMIVRVASNFVTQTQDPTRRGSPGLQKWQIWLNDQAFANSSQVVAINLFEARPWEIDKPVNQKTFFISA